VFAIGLPKKEKKLNIIMNESIIGVFEKQYYFILNTFLLLVRELTILVALDLVASEDRVVLVDLGDPVASVGAAVLEDPEVPVATIIDLNSDPRSHLYDLV
jgi:hypothetical protein